MKHVVIALLKEGNAITLHFSLRFVTINILNKERKRGCTFVEFGRKLSFIILSETCDRM